MGTGIDGLERQFNVTRSFSKLIAQVSVCAGLLVTVTLAACDRGTNSFGLPTPLQVENSISSGIPLGSSKSDAIRFLKSDQMKSAYGNWVFKSDYVIKPYSSITPEFSYSFQRTLLGVI